MNRETIIIPESKEVIKNISTRANEGNSLTPNNYLLKEALNRSKTDFKIDVSTIEIDDAIMNGIGSATTTNNKLVAGSLDELALNGSHEEKEAEIEKLKRSIDRLVLE